MSKCKMRLLTFSSASCFLDISAYCCRCCVLAFSRFRTRLTLSSKAFFLTSSYSMSEYCNVVLFIELSCSTHLMLISLYLFPELVLEQLVSCQQGLSYLC